METLKEKGYRVYYNLHKGGYSIQGYIKGKGWRVVDYTEHLYALNVTFKVYEAGRQKVLREKKKNVHAYVLCKEYKPISKRDVEEVHHRYLTGISTKIVYNPYMYDQFTWEETQAPVTDEQLVVTLANKTVYVLK